LVGQAASELHLRGVGDRVIERGWQQCVQCSSVATTICLREALTLIEGSIPAEFQKDLAAAATIIRKVQKGSQAENLLKHWSNWNTLQKLPASLKALTTPTQKNQDIFDALKMLGLADTACKAVSADRLLPNLCQEALLAFSQQLSAQIATEFQKVWSELGIADCATFHEYIRSGAGSNKSVDEKTKTSIEEAASNFAV